MRLIERFDTSIFEPALWLETERKVKGIISTDRLPRFEHINAESIEDAVFLLKTYESRAAIIAGGTDLLRELKNRVRPAQPKVLINIKTVRPKLDYIAESATCLKIGSLATLHDVETSPLINKKYGILARAAHATRALQYRNIATIGGDLCQQVKCWYYRASQNAYFCYRKGGDKCYAVDGDNRCHSIFGGEGCFATCSSDTAPALVALDAKIKIVGTSGERTVPVEKFFTRLGNILRPDEIITEIQIPIPEPNSISAFLKFGVPNKFSPAIAGVAVVARIQNNLCQNASIVLGAVSPVPWRATAAEEMLVRKRITRERAESAAQVATAGITPLSMNGYKADIVRTLVKRAILEMAQKD